MGQTNDSIVAPLCCYTSPFSAAHEKFEGDDERYPQARKVILGLGVATLAMRVRAFLLRAVGWLAFQGIRQ